MHGETVKLEGTFVSNGQQNFYPKFYLFFYARSDAYLTLP